MNSTKSHIIIPKTRVKLEQAVKVEMAKDFTFVQSINLTLISAIAMMLALLMLNAVWLNKLDVVPSICFEEWLRLKIESYNEEIDLSGVETDNVIGMLVGALFAYVIRLMVDLYVYIGNEFLPQTHLYEAATLIILIDIGFMILVMSIIYRQLTKKVKIISIILGFIVTYIVIVLVMLLIFSFAFGNPFLFLEAFGYTWWTPKTLLATTIILEYMMGIRFIVWFYVFAVMFAMITSLTAFIAQRILNPMKKFPIPETSFGKAKKKEERDDAITWIIISTVTGAIVATIWRQIVRIGETAFGYIERATEFKITPLFIILMTIVGFTIGYVIAYMISYAIYKRAVGKRNIIEVYRIRTTPFKEKVVNWLIFTGLMSLLYYYTLHLRIFELNTLITFMVNFVISFLATLGGKMTRIKYE